MREDEIIAGCRRGDSGSQEELYRQTSKRVYQLFLRITRNRDDAFDLTHSTYLKVFRSINGFRGGSRLTTWLYRIAMNEALQFLRVRAFRSSKHAEVSRATAQPSDNFPGLTDGVMDLAEAMSHLSEEHRSLLTLRYLQELSYQEIAEVLRIAPGSVASGLNRARQALRERLEAKNMRGSGRSPQACASNPNGQV